MGKKTPPPPAAPGGELPGAPDPELLDDAALQAELSALMPLADQDALSDPLTLAMHLNDRMVSRPHLRVISQAVSQMTPNGGDRILITTPPQVGKSELAIWGVFWWLCQYPKARVIIGSYGTLLATKRGRAIRRLVQQYGHRYGLELETGSGAANDWKLTSGGGVRSAGVGSGITGEPADIALLDDLIKGRAEADSPAIREKTWDWWSGDLTSRLAPGAPAMLVMTRWSDDDIAARLLAEEGTVEDGGRWRVIYMPAIATALEDGPGFADGLGRRPGEPLTHPRIATSDVRGLRRHWDDKKRSSTPRDWGALYMGNPRPTEGALLDRGVLRERRCYQPEVMPIKAAVAVDPSGGGKDEAGVVGGWLGSDRKVYISHDRSGRMSAEEWAEAACRLAVELDADKIIYESNYGGDTIDLAIRSMWADLVRRGVISDGVMRPALFKVHARKGKVLRAEPIAQQFMIDNVRLASAMPELEDEWATWQPSSQDSPGRIDASAYLVYGLLPMPGVQGMAGTMVSAANISRRMVSGMAVSQMPSMSQYHQHGVVLPFHRRRGPGHWTQATIPRTRSGH